MSPTKASSCLGSWVTLFPQLARSVSSPSFKKSFLLAQTIHPPRALALPMEAIARSSWLFRPPKQQQPQQQQKSAAAKKKKKKARRNTCLLWEMSTLKIEAKQRSQLAGWRKQCAFLRMGGPQEYDQAGEEMRSP